MPSSLSWAVAASIAVSAGCAARQPQPIVISSARATGYALGYADELNAASSTLAADQTRTGELLPSLRAGRQLKPGADQSLVLGIVAQADEAGRGAAFASANAQAREVRSFWDEERGPISARVSSVAQKQVTDAGCKADVGNGVSYALKDGVDRQMEKRLRARNEAQRTIELNKTLLGPQGNVIALQTLADDVAMTSYLVNSALVQDRDRLERLLADQGDVDSTLGSAIEHERALQGNTGVPAAERKASQERAVALEKSRASIPAAAAAGKTALKDVDAKIEKARKDYQAALEALDKQLRGQTTASAQH